MRPQRFALCVGGRGGGGGGGGDGCGCGILSPRTILILSHLINSSISAENEKAFRTGLRTNLRTDGRTYGPTDGWMDLWTGVIEMRRRI